MNKPKPARLDADRAAKAKTRLLAHATPDRYGFVLAGPADTYEGEDGERVGLVQGANTAPSKVREVSCPSCNGERQAMSGHARCYQCEVTLFGPEGFA